MSPVDIVILILAVLCVGGAIALALGRRKNGRSGCGCSSGCTGCPQAGRCGSKDCPDKDDKCDKCSQQK